MPFEIVRNDIAKMAVDAIVNTANPRPVIGLGTDSMIHEAAGPGLLRSRQEIGHIDMGQAAITPAFNLQAKYVIHTVGPVWDGGSYGEEGYLRNCYENSLRLALEYNCQSIAFPLISTGNYGFPKDKALQIAISAFSEFLLEHEMQIYLVVFDRTSFKLSEKMFQSVASYIDENYVELCENTAFCARAARNPLPRRETARMAEDAKVEQIDGIFSIFAKPGLKESPAVGGVGKPHSRVPQAGSKSLEDMLKQVDAGFTQTLLKLIDKTGKKDSEIYKRANISKQHFSKIRNNPNYKPTKPTAIALALALELSLEDTKDLIGRAGYALTNSSKFDLIIRYFIEQGNYNVVEINIALYEFDQTLLGA